MKRPIYLNTRITAETERLNRTANEYRDYWLLALGIAFGLIIWMFCLSS